MQLFNVLAEARKNPVANPKTSPNEIIAKYANDSSRYVNMAKIPKLGVNPKSDFLTPIGICAYPIAYVHSVIKDDFSLKGLPFAGDSKYVNIFQARGNLVAVDKMSKSQEQQYYTELMDLDPMVGTYEDWIKQIDTHIFDAPTETIHNSPGGRFWYVTMKLSEYVAETAKQTSGVVWNKILRLLGIDGVTDDGVGILGENEPHQAIFLTINAVYNNFQMENKYAPAVLATRGNAKHTNIANRNRIQARMPTPQPGVNRDEQLVDHILRHNDVEMIDTLRSRNARLLLLKRRPTMISEFPNPSAEEQYTALVSGGGEYMLSTIWGMITPAKRNKHSLQQAREFFATGA